METTNQSLAETDLIKYPEEQHSSDNENIHVTTTAATTTPATSTPAKGVAGEIAAAALQPMETQITENIKSEIANNTSCENVDLIDVDDIPNAATAATDVSESPKLDMDSMEQTLLGADVCFTNCVETADAAMEAVDIVGDAGAASITCTETKNDSTEDSAEVQPASGEQTKQSQQTEATQKMREECEAKLCEQRTDYERKLEQLRAALAQKDSMITLFQRENAILEKEKEAFRKEKDLANKEREATVIKFAMKEKSVIDAKKDKEGVEKQLSDAKKEIKNYSTKFQALNEEKSRVAYLMDEKCNEIRKYQRECEKLKTENGHLESKLKYHINKLNMETEAKAALEKKLEEERNAPNKLEEKANEKLRIEFEAQTILLKHEITSKTEHLDKLLKDCESKKVLIAQLQEQLSHETEEKLQLSETLNALQEEHNQVQNAYSMEMLNSAKLRGQLEELQVLKTQHTLNEDKIATLSQELQEALVKLQDNEQDLNHLHEKEKDLLSFNREMSESIVDLQNVICLLKSKAQGIEAENVLLKKEKSLFDEKLAEIEQRLQLEKNQKNEERLLLAKHLSEKTKLYENTKLKLDNVQGDFEATKNKHATVVKELQREILKLRRSADQNIGNTGICSKCQQPSEMNGYHHKSSDEQLEARRTHSRQSSHSTTAQSVSSAGSRRASESSESDTVTGRELDFKDENKGPSKKHLVERILRLQQASARQAEKIDFLEQHTLSLVAELQKKSKVVQYYMLRDQAGALTSSKSDQNKSELAKYGSGVMSAIYSGIKGVENKSMSLELSLEINKKLQAVLEDTLLKNITLKENLDVLGLEVDNLTRKLRQIESRS